MMFGVRLQSVGACRTIQYVQQDLQQPVLALSLILQLFAKVWIRQCVWSQPGKLYEQRAWKQSSSHHSHSVQVFGTTLCFEYPMERFSL